MARTRILVVFLVAVLLMSTALTVSIMYGRKGISDAEMTVDAGVYEDAANTLKGFLGMRDDGSSGKFSKGRKAEAEDAKYAEGARMTQRVTIFSENGVLPISGTVTKTQDAYYPGTYELKFGNKAILSSDANVCVSLNVNKGDKVYILTGDRENGYVEYKTVEAQQDNMIAFDTSVIQDYTLSTTDIVSAQEAMAMLFDN